MTITWWPRRALSWRTSKEIFSHPQAISQCSAYLEKLGKDVKITPCENTAAAAEAVAQSDRKDVAAIASHSCVALYGLERLAADIQDRSNNYTRFICISKKLEIYPGADKTSLMVVLPHRPGSLYQILARFYALGLNLIKLESRPLPDREFEFMFYFDLETSVYSDEFIRMVDDLSAVCEEFQYLGSYSEVI
ncbi:MAG: prephenate dehydratase [Evtepia gabavorous]